MNKTIALACLLCSSPLLAASTGPEVQRAVSNSSFSALSDFKPKHARAAGVAAKAVPRSVKAQQTRYVHVTGNVNLNGSGNYTHGSNFVWVNFSGYATVTDSTGRITSNSTWFNRNVGCNVSNGWVNCDDYATWYVDFYKDGRSVGHGSVTGSLHASAYAPNGFFTASAYTMLSGDVTVTEP